ncbi:MAG: serpin family protein [Proteobacteria bacterium]|nr:serpin family protein [Pseudomonadota bacterium]
MRTFKMFLFAAAIACFAAGCSDSDSDSNSNSNSSNPSKPGNSKAAVDVQMTEAALTAADVPAVEDKAAKDWGKDLNSFGMDFMHKLDGNSNLVFSPFSLHSALSMTACGAGTDTLKEMADVLHVSNDAANIAKESGAMSLHLRFDGQTEGSKFSIANRIWVDSSAEVVPTFKTYMNDQFKAPLQIVDFVGHAAEIVGIINEWVSNVTNKMIPNLLKPNDVNSNTQMVLVNAIHFDGEWKYKFQKDKTQKADFSVNATDKIKVDMMNQSTNVNYYENDSFKAIVMPYVGDKFSMLFMLPNEMDKLPVMLDGLDGSAIAKIITDAENIEVSIALPKFKIESSIDNSIDILKSLGMKLAFTDAADFKQMISNFDVFISKIIHKAVIEVDEEGTRAAAATAVSMEKNGVSMDKKTFHADHPFAFALIHNDSNGILFAGQYVGK